MNFLDQLTDEERDKYLKLKEAQDLLFYVVMRTIQGQAHTVKAQVAYSQLVHLDASIELLEMSLEDAQRTLEHMTVEEVTEMLEDTRELHKEYTTQSS
jgi:hypothetical protein